MSTPRVWISEITFNDGTTLNFNDNDIVVLVGPNNTGKSVALSELLQKTQERGTPGKIIHDIKLDSTGSKDELLVWLEETCFKSGEDQNSTLYSRPGIRINLRSAQNLWGNMGNGLRNLTGFFVELLTTEARLSAANPAPAIAITKDRPSHPIHFLQRHDETESLVSSYFNSAFKKDLIIHRNAGNIVPLYCGTRPVPNEGENRVSVNYLNELEQLPLLQEQGDGMRSFTGVLLHFLVLDHSILLIDEPDVFLHPPQAKLIGKMMVKEVSNNRQFFLATHSSDLLQGLLDSDGNRVRVIRIQREGDTNKICELDNRAWE